MKLCQIPAVLLAALILSGCSDSYEAAEPGPVEDGGMEEAAVLFEETDFSGGKTVTRFQTSDSRYWSGNGYTLWTVWGDELPFTDRTVKLNKPKGYEGAGYGLVICQGARFFEGREEKTMLTVMINNNGQYALGKVIGSRYESMQGWTNSSFIREGPGAPNTITVRSNGDGFVLLINDHAIRTFSDGAEPRHSGGRNGYIVVIAPSDNNTQGGVDVYFTETK
ncbi:MAG: hypothetical protein LBO80_01505 [Treponema sp.]|jgi:hypothetical protein|nr:hypothetical protein [Treponema sp.]